MESTQPQFISASEFAPANAKNATPFSQQTVVLTKQDYIEIKWEANYWRAQHARLDVHFISSLPVMQGNAYKAWVDSKPVQRVWAED